MLDALSLDQLRMFIAAADQGSFSAAARSLRRAQSAVSEALSGVEAQLGVTLFDRTGRYPVLTSAGRILLGDARAIIADVDILKARAKGISSGLESELALVVDVFYPMEPLTRAATAFRERFPLIPLRIYVDALGGVFQSLSDTDSAFGIAGSLPVLPDGLASEPLTEIEFVMVAAVDHPLAAKRGIISRADAAQHPQIVLTDRSKLTAGRDLGVVSHTTWRVSDLFAKQAFILNGLGWGGMPKHVIEADLASGRLVRIQVESMPPDGLSLPMSAVYPLSKPPGPAGRWLLDTLAAIASECPERLAEIRRQIAASLKIDGAGERAGDEIDF